MPRLSAVPVLWERASTHDLPDLQTKSREIQKSEFPKLNSSFYLIFCYSYILASKFEPNVSDLWLVVPTSPQNLIQEPGSFGSLTCRTNITSKLDPRARIIRFPDLSYQHHLKT
ncbi:hypothetical protein RRG08_059657 [Elysia crispata]|uniref:Uncharacterized protein n=1 Tax=Elysia crispata TaxID=231223 RepID=A0AAE1B610_9GAST|nr:hypothetical protein RRG08_059657 [Elysia crispata]